MTAEGAAFLQSPTSMGCVAETGSGVPCLDLNLNFDAKLDCVVTKIDYDGW